MQMRKAGGAILAAANKALRSDKLFAALQICRWARRGGCQALCRV